MFVLTMLYCMSFCEARFFDGGFPRNGECACYEIVEQDTPPAMFISGAIREKSNQEPRWRDAGASLE